MKLILGLFIIFTTSISYSVMADDYEDFSWRELRAACKGNHDSDACLE